MKAASVVIGLVLLCCYVASALCSLAITCALLR